MQTILEVIGENAFYHNKSFNRILFETVSIIISNHINAHNANKKIKHFYDQLTGDEKFWALTKSSATSKKHLLARFEFVEQLFRKKSTNE